MDLENIKNDIVEKAQGNLQEKEIEEIMKNIENIVKEQDEWIDSIRYTCYERP